MTPSQKELPESHPETPEAEIEMEYDVKFIPRMYTLFILC